MPALKPDHLARAKHVPGTALAALVILGLAACGPGAPAAKSGQGATVASAAASAGQATQDSTTTTVDACHLVTQDEAAAVLGVGVKSPMSNGGGLACVYLPVSGSLPELSVNMVQGAGAGVNRAAYDAAASGVADKVDVSGLGDAAFSSGGGRSINFLKGSVVVLITVQAADQSIDYADKLLKAAQTAAGRIR